MSRALPCIAEPISYAGTGYCELDCTSGDVEIGQEQPTQPNGFASHCGGSVPADSVCEVYCFGTDPRVTVVPEPGYEAFALGALLAVALARC